MNGHRDSVATLTPDEAAFIGWFHLKLQLRSTIGGMSLAIGAAAAALLAIWLAFEPAVASVMHSLWLLAILPAISFGGIGLGWLLFGRAPTMRLRRELHDSAVAWLTSERQDRLRQYARAFPENTYVCGTIEAITKAMHDATNCTVPAHQHPIS